MKTLASTENRALQANYTGRRPARQEAKAKANYGNKN
jgi:hypothetical protein